jgi:hypothetical protein
MPILGIEKKRTDTRLVGVHLPPRSYGYISLYSIAKGVAKNNLFKSLIDSWTIEQRQKESDETLLGEVAERISLRWREDKDKNPNLSYPTFKQLVEKELLYKGINEGYITKIMSQVENGSKNKK